MKSNKHNIHFSKKRLWISHVFWIRQGKRTYKSINEESLKYLKSTTLSCKEIRIRKSKLMAKTQYLYDKKLLVLNLVCTLVTLQLAITSTFSRDINAWRDEGRTVDPGATWWYSWREQKQFKPRLVKIKLFLSLHPNILVFHFDRLQFIF